MLSICAAVYADGNILDDPSFERGDTGHLRLRKFTWKKGEGSKTVSDGSLKAYCDTAAARTGKGSMCFENQKAGAINELNYKKSFDCKAGEKYLFSFHYMLSAENPAINGRIMFYNAQGKECHYQFVYGLVNEQNKWLKAQKEITVPPNAVSMRLTISFSGKGKLYLDDLYLGRVRQSKGKAISMLIQESKDFTIWQEQPWNKVPRKGTPGAFREAKPFVISAARNEREAFQLVAGAKKALKNVSLEFGTFRDSAGNVLPEKSFFYETVGYITANHPEKTSLRGEHPDPLLAETAVDIPAGTNRSFFITADIPAQAKPGLYSGKVILKEQGGKIAEFPMSVKVYSFALPEIPALPTYFYFQLQYAMPHDKRDPAVIVDDVYSMYKRLHFTGNQAENRFYPRPPVKIEQDTLTVTDWSRFDRRVEELRDKYGFRYFPVPYLRMMGGYEGWFSSNLESNQKKSPFGNCLILSERSLSLMGQFAKQFTEHVKKKFPELTFFCYIYDEPPERLRPEVKKLTDTLHRYAPDLKIFIPMEVADNAGYVHTYCVPMTEYYIDWDKQEQKRRQGHDIWYYNWQPLLEDSRYMTSRLYAWQIYANHGSGGLIWNTMYAPKGFSPWTAWSNPKGFDGSATILYPPRKAGEKVMPSMRAIQIADGIEDFAYLKELEKRIDSHYPGKGRKRVLEIIREMITDLKFDYVNDPSLPDRLRRRTAEEIEQWDAGFPCLLTTSPEENTATELSEIEAEFFAPSGTTLILPDKKTLTVPDSGRLKFRVSLDKNGENLLEFTVATGKGKASITRRFLRKEDRNLAALRALQKEFPFAESAEVLKKVSGKSYGRAERDFVSGTLEKHRAAFLKKELASLEKLPGTLSAMFRKRAGFMFANRLPERAEYYVRLSRLLGKTDFTGFKVKAEAVTWKGLPGVRLSNGTLDVIVLECGGRIVSFVCQGTEMFSQNGVVVPGELVRAKRETSEKWVTKYSGSSGLEDADGGSLWPISFVDWDLDFRVLRPDCITLSAETMLPGGIFRFRRNMTLRAGSPRLEIRYSITNVLPDTFISDNPGHYELAWRARLIPEIGGSRQNDTLTVSGNPALPACTIGGNGRTKYEMPSIRLDRNYAGVFDTELGKGMAVKFDPAVITHAYVWFDAWSRMREFYTLEFPRSNYLQKNVSAKDKNKPFLIKPGQTMTFDLNIQGISAQTLEEFKKLCEK